MNWYMAVIRKYAEFNGRARRQEYWMFFLMNFLIVVLIGILGGIVSALLGKLGGLISSVFSSLYAIFIFIPGIAVTVRRLHDTNKSGWWILLNLIPPLGQLILLIFMVIDSDPNDNTYGPNPKHAPDPS